MHAYTRPIHRRDWCKHTGMADVRKRCCKTHIVIEKVGYSIRTCEEFVSEKYFYSFQSFNFNEIVIVYNNDTNELTNRYDWCIKLLRKH